MLTPTEPGAGAVPRRDPALAALHLMALTSPALPVGAFAYSQGLEAAVEAGLVRDEASADAWILGLLGSVQARLDVPRLARMYAAFARRDPEAALRESARLLAGRESRELQDEDIAQGQALGRLLRDLGVEGGAVLAAHADTTWACAFARAATHFGIGLAEASSGYLFAWATSQVAAAVKLVPLGQTSGQRITLRAIAAVPAAVTFGLALDDAEIGAAAPVLACLSAQHETQYTRLFRS